MSALDLIVSALGLSFGSFISACAYRIPRGISVVAPRSFCPSCKSILKWYDVIPLVGIAINRGKCRECGAKIPVADLAIELLAAVLVLLMFFQYGMSLQFLLSSTLTLFLVLIACIDWQHLVIPNKVVAFGIAIGLMLVLASWQVDALLKSLIGLAGGGAFMLAIMLLANWFFKKETMGMGDIKLAAMIGLYVGLEGFLISLWLAAISGAFFGFGRMVLKGRVQDDRLPFGSFLAGSSVLYLIFQSQINEWIQLWLTSTLS
jgi:leader peptidase (prepilin peptidase)/N-methyltransferase